MIISFDASAAEIGQPSWLESQDIEDALASSTLMLKGKFHLLPESEPDDGTGVPGSVIKVSFSITRVFKGVAAVGDDIAVYVPNDIIEFDNSSISRRDFFFFRQEQATQAKMQLVQKYDFYENEYIEGRLSSSEMEAIEQKFAAAYQAIMESSSSTSITPQRGGFEGAPRKVRDILIEEGQEYIIALVPRGGTSDEYSLLPQNRGMYSDLDVVLVEKRLAE